MPPILLGERGVTLLRGRRDGLEVTLSPHDLQEGFTELQARLTEQPSFYRGASAVVNFGAASPSAEDLHRLRELFDDAGIGFRGVRGFDDRLEGLAQQAGLIFESLPPQLQARRERRPQAEVSLSESARSLVADFAGARNDIAARRRRGEASVPRLHTEPASARSAPTLHVVESSPGTLYQAATLRGGQVLHHTGNIVVVGDVNPGAELIATGDILVFGRLAGIAHAGAQGDESARIYALDLAPTQLRIATFIAAEGETKRRAAPVPEVALTRDGRIIIVTLDRLSDIETFEASST
jgi:septum site-determining protein MinC